jgi:hypothetical protein
MAEKHTQSEPCQGCHPRAAYPLAGNRQSHPSALQAQVLRTGYVDDFSVRV